MSQARKRRQAYLQQALHSGLLQLFGLNPVVVLGECQ
jgi:hypothetical protein